MSSPSRQRGRTPRAKPWPWATSARRSPKPTPCRVGVNAFAVSHIEAPFGGVKDSGYGCEGGSEGLAGHLHMKYLNHC
jgi:acyl-CoA reductase-like NAD-dependent aldehyde dehydrogenase